MDNVQVTALIAAVLLAGKKTSADNTSEPVNPVAEPKATAIA